MYRRLTWRLAALIAALIACSGAADAVEWFPATVQLSDGTTIEGQVYIPRDKLLIMREGKPNTTVRVPEMARYDCAVEKESMEEEWVFKESGLDDKIFTGEHFPVRHYLGTATFHDGTKLTGHIQPGTLFVKTPEGNTKFILRRKEEGKVGQQLEDLVYVQSVVFHETAGGVRGTISGTIDPPDGEKVARVLALNRVKLYVLEGSLDRRSGRFEFDGCTSGIYDLIVLTDKGIYLWFSRESEPGCARLGPGKLKAINEWQARLRDFFHERVVLHAGGSESQLFGLARMERHGGTTSGQVQFVRRWEVWSMHMPANEWQIEKRFFVDRCTGKQGLPDQRAIHVQRALGGHKLDADRREIELNLRLEHGDEPLTGEDPKE